MRITIDLDPKAYAVAQSIAQRRQMTLGQVISELLLAEPKPSDDDMEIRISPITGFPTFRSTHPVTIEDVNAMMDQED
jgi:predicted DNA-binding ribbon-helix-helix protein